MLLSIPFGLMLAFLTPLIWFQVGGGILFLAGSYTCLKTRCINQMENANALARFLGTLVEMVMLLVIGVAMLTLALGLVTTGIVVLAIGLLIIRAIKR